MMEHLARAHVLEFAGVLCKHLGRPRRQGRVDEYPRMRQTAGVDEHGNVEEQLLRPLKREYRDDEIAATRQRSLDFGFQERRSEEHTSELQSLMRISYAVFCLKKKNNQRPTTHTH